MIVFTDYLSHCQDKVIVLANMTKVRLKKQPTTPLPSNQPSSIYYNQILSSLMNKSDSALQIHQCALSKADLQTE